MLCASDRSQSVAPLDRQPSGKQLRQNPFVPSTPISGVDVSVRTSRMVAISSA